MSFLSKNPTLKGCRTHHIAIQTRDWDASMALYQDVLGMKVVAEFGAETRRIRLLDIGDGSHIELFQPTDDTPAVTEDAANDPVMHFALGVDDTAAAIEHVRQAGYTVTMEPKTIDIGAFVVTIAFFTGPSGESIEFVQTM